VSGSSLIRQDIVPMAAGYLLVMAALAIGLRRLRRLRGPAPRPGPARERARARAAEQAGGPVGLAPPAPGPLRWTRLIRHALSTAIAGYLLLGAVVTGYCYAIARVAGQFLQSAFTGTALLLAIALPAFAIASGLTEWRRRRRGRPPGSRPGGDRPAARHLPHRPARGLLPGRGTGDEPSSPGSGSRTPGRSGAEEPSRLAADVGSHAHRGPASGASI
jgi:hypothetical protein